MTTPPPGKSTRRRAPLVLVAVAIIAVAVVGGVLLFNRPAPVKPTGVTRSFTLVQRDFNFNGTNPGPELQVNLGDELKITVINNGGGGHDFTLLTKQLVASPYTTSVGDIWHQSTGGTGAILPEKSTTLTFLADKQGSFTYLCSVAGHADAGMIGRVVIK